MFNFKLFLLIITNNCIFCGSQTRVSSFYEFDISRNEFPGIRNIKLTLMNVKEVYWSIGFSKVFWIELAFTTNTINLVECCRDDSKKNIDDGYFFISSNKSEKIEGYLNKKYEKYLGMEKWSILLNGFNFDIIDDKLSWKVVNGKL